MKAEALDRPDTVVQSTATLVRRYKYPEFNVQNHLYVETLACSPL
jgi:hypothetical protein